MSLKVKNYKEIIQKKEIIKQYLGFLKEAGIF